MSSGTLALLDRAVSQRRASLLIHAADADPVPVQLMGLYRIRGREADATVVVLCSGDYYGKERPPFPSGLGCSMFCSSAPGTRPSCSCSAAACPR